ncbi:piggyBac transposable element-derived protein 3-like [Homalodisca vitripennis]|uniref:piggyBac transposable element-derived protein 3-like n=1 Tax=Homalodisca vitripennis TaxID=197043 RepID=UPI001EEB2B6A|nr:piggyBac transposable element-derived protein 3-like [Homalodisca vitripennis]
MVKFKGQNAMKQYIKNKPVKWGFKLWCRCDSETGYLYQFDIYTGKKTNPERGLGEGIILQMTENLGGKGIQFYFDNFFNSPLLQTEMLEKQLMACGTVRSERKEMPKCLKSDKEMSRGDIDFASTDKGVSCVKWMDNRSVLMISNFISPLGKVTVERRQKGSNEKVKIDCPKMVNEYNKYMGGVDLMDQKKSDL